MLGLLIGMMGTLLVRDCTSNDIYDEMDEIPEEKEKAEFVVCWKKDGGKEKKLAKTLCGDGNRSRSGWFPMEQRGEEMVADMSKM